MTICDTCNGEFQFVGRSKNKWLCLDCMSDLARQAEDLVVASCNLTDKANAMLKSEQAKCKRLRSDKRILKIKLDSLTRELKSKDETLMLVLDTEIEDLSKELKRKEGR